MSILTDPIPDNWPKEAKTLVCDLRKAFVALEQSLDKEQYVLKVDPVLSDEISMEARKYGFQPSEMKLWRALRSNSRGVWTKEALYSALECGSASTKIVDVHICKLRKRLFVAKAPWQIRTCWGQGYQVIPLNSVSDVLLTSQKVPEKVRRELLQSIPAGVGGVTWTHLKAALLGLGLTQTKMAKTLGVPSKHVFLWCNGAAQMPERYGMTVANMVRRELCKLSGVNSSHLAPPRMQQRQKENSASQEAA